jgi:hypothetical protein
METQTGVTQMTNGTQEHDTTPEPAVRVVIRRDEWVKARPWRADVVFPDGQVWLGWQSEFRSKKALIENARAALDFAGMHNARIDHMNDKDCTELDGKCPKCGDESLPESHTGTKRALCDDCLGDHLDVAEE